jgi:N6-L-threonylcarbamoyladenine synthase
LPRKNPHDFSFSGLKTAVLYAARGQAAGRKGELLLDEQQVADVAASFQAAVTRALVKRTVKAAREKGARWIALGGGVAANRSLREALTAAAKVKIDVAAPPLDLCGDNAVMIAARAGEMFAAGQLADLELDAASR